MLLDDRLSELLLRWEESRDEGRPISVEELCRDCPELFDELKRRIAVLDSVNAVLASTPDGGDPISHARQSSDAAAELGRQFQTTSTFRTLRFHARGGKGHVFIARDDELGRDVALKIISSRRAADSQGRERFLREARITSLLEHPGTAPVFCIGRDETGRPFYCARYVEGETLAEAIRQFHAGTGRLGLQQLLNRFIAVCNTIAYAHSREVVHRDIKPANIVLGPYGETIVLDWGLAKFAAQADEPVSESDADRGSGSSDTRAGSAIGTPAYMSPEQAAGELDAIGPASDVYSLGATLFAILTGEPPVEGRSVGEVLDRVRRGDIRPPHRVRPGVPPALDAICLKAIARIPHDRYSSPLELAADVEHWLADEPVSCYREPAAARVARWARRHKPIVTGVTALVMTATLALAISTILVGQQRARAEDRFRQARQAVDDSFTRVSQNTLLGVPGLRPLRKELLEAALGYYQRFLEERSSDATLQRDVAVTWSRVGEITAETGTPSAALAAYRKSHEIYARLAAPSPNDVALQRDLAASLERIGRLHAALGKTGDAAEVYRECTDILEELTRSRPADADTRDRLASVYLLTGLLLESQSQPDAAREQFRKARDIAAELAREHPERATFLHTLARSHESLAELEVQSGAIDAAADAFDAAGDILQELVRLDAKNHESHQSLARVITRIGDLQSSSKSEVTQIASAIESFRTARQIRERLVRDHPSVFDFRRELAELLEKLGAAQRAAGEHTAALESLVEARQTRSYLAEPVNMKLEEAISGTYFDTGVWHRAHGRIEEAARALRQASEIRNQTGLPPDPKLDETLGRNHLLIGYQQWEIGRLEDAAQSFDLARATLERLVVDQPENAGLRAGLAASHLGHAMSLDFLQRHDEALAANQRTIDLLHEAVAADPSPFNRIGLSCSYFLMEGIYRKLGRAADADQAAEQTRKFQPPDADSLYALAREFSFYAALAGKGKEQYSPADRFEFQHYSDRAVECLRAAVDAGFKDFDRLNNDPALAVLGGHAGFRSLRQRQSTSPNP